MGVISSGLRQALEWAMPGVPFDFVEANELVVDRGEIVGYRIRVPFEGKGEVLSRVASSLGVPASRIAVVGDDVNDLSMFRLPVGLRIAFHPRSREVEEEADLVVWGDLREASDAILKWFGLRRTARQR